MYRMWIALRSIAQIRERKLYSVCQGNRYACSINWPLIKKEAGPKISEHMVDIVLQFEGDPNLLYRARSSKTVLDPQTKLIVHHGTIQVRRS